MTHQIERNDHYVGGESITWTFSVEEDGSAKNLDGGSVEWYIVSNRGDQNSDAVFDHTDTGISATISDPTNGIVEVEIESGTTEDYAGSMLWQRLIIEDSAGNTQIWNGRFPIQER